MRQADLAPTRYFLWFDTAERMHMSVRQMLTGAPGPLTAMEERLWQRKRVVDARLEQQRHKHAKGARRAPRR